MTLSLPRLGLLLSLLAASSGCSRGGERLTIGTNWPEADCRALETELRQGWPVRITWVRVAPGEDPTRLIDRRVAVDVVLGGPVSSYQRLVRANRLESSDWRIARRSRIGLAVNNSASGRPVVIDDITAREFTATSALGDPRHDPLTFAWMKQRFSRDDWASAYASLVRAAAKARRVAPEGGSAVADVTRGAAAAAPAIESQAAGAGLDFAPLPDGELVEGAAIAPGAAHRPSARAMLDTFGPPESQPPADVTPARARSDALLADLLGAALVDAQDELWAAREVLDRAGWPEKLAGFLVEAPPWPPASVTRMQSEPDPARLIETLAEQIAPETYDRAWLFESWDRPTRPLDGALLDELSRAVGGRLAANVRFRAWLRAEWTAWARQRYRRVARRAEGGQP